MTVQITRYLLIALALSGGFGGHAQQPVPVFADSLAVKLNYYAKQKGSGLLYAHFDKTVYGNNEHVWFTSYLLKDPDKDRDSVVSVILVGAVNQSIFLEDRFLITDGISPGHLVLPDSIPTGDYRFILYTDKVVKGIPRSLFVQQVHIRNTNTSPAGTKAGSARTNTGPAGSPSAGRPADGPSGGRSVSKVKSTGDTKPAGIVKFYPEGGSLSAEMVNTVGWEVKTPSGIPLQVTGIVYKDGVAIDTVSTGPYGMGVFKLRPEGGRHYRFRLAGGHAGGDRTLSADTATIFELPPVVTDRPVISIPEALTGDTLKLTISNRRSAKFFLVIHNYDDLFFLLPLQAGPEGRIFQIALTDLPKGIAAITVLDSLQRPCAERLFFAHYDRRNRVNIQTDRTSYNTGDSGSLRLSLRSPEGQPAYGMVSVAIVQASRLSLRNRNNIESWLYLNHELGFLPFKEDYLGYNPSDSGVNPRAEDKEYLENVLRIKGWRNYNWAEASSVTPADTLIRYDSLNFTGSVTRSGRRLKKPVSLVLMKGREVNLLNTDATGTFRISYADLSTAENKKIYLMVNGDNPGSYKITVKDAFEPVSRSVSAMARPVSAPDMPMDDPLIENENAKGWKKIGNLKEVVVTARNNNSFYATRKKVNACGDYVCRYGFLDCPYHTNDFDNIAPVDGKSYKILDGSAGADGVEMFHTVVYQECVVKKPETGSVILNGIRYGMDFYRDDDTGQDPKTDDFISTLYWKHLYKIAPDGTLPIRFPTGNITGRFKIIVQGIGENDVLYGEGSLLVR